MLEKLAGLGATALKSNFAELDKPYKLNFCVTYWCQSRCLTCNIWDIRPKGELSIEEIKQFAEKNNYFQWIELTGGEPFLRSDIVEIAKTFKQTSKNLYILTLPTNSLCNQDKVEKGLIEILNLGIPRVAITVSLDGHKELHDKIRGIPGNYEKAISMFKRLMALKKTYKNLYFVFGYTMSKFNQGQFEATYQGVKKDIPTIRYSDFHMNLAQTSANYYKNAEADIRPDYAVAAQEIEDVLKKREFEIGIIPFVEGAFLKKLAYYARTGKQPLRGRSLEASLYLDSWGNIYPSIMWDRKIANLRDIEYDLSKVWHADAATKTREEAKQGKEPVQWTSCEAYQTLTGNIIKMLI